MKIRERRKSHDGTVKRGLRRRCDGSGIPPQIFVDLQCKKFKSLSAFIERKYFHKPK